MTFQFLLEVLHLSNKLLSVVVLKFHFLKRLRWVDFLVVSLQNLIVPLVKIQFILNMLNWKDDCLVKVYISNKSSFLMLAVFKEVSKNEELQSDPHLLFYFVRNFQLISNQVESLPEQEKNSFGEWLDLWTVSFWWAEQVIHFRNSRRVSSPNVLKKSVHFSIYDSTLNYGG